MAFRLTSNSSDPVDTRQMLLPDYAEAFFQQLPILFSYLFYGHSTLYFDNLLTLYAGCSNSIIKVLQRNGRQRRLFSAIIDGTHPV